MFWKHVKKIPLLFPKKPKALDFFTSNSLTKRLTISLILTAFGILLLASLIPYYTLTCNLKKSGEQFLIGQIQFLRSMMQENPQDLAALKQEVVLEPTYVVGNKDKNKYFIRILDHKKKLLMETPGMANLISAENFPDVPPDATKLKAHSWRSNSKHHEIFLLMSDEIKLPGSSESRYVQIALNQHRETNIIESYQETLFWIMVIGILVSGGLGIWIVRQGLSPLKNMAKSMGKITAAELHQRLDTRDWPKELATVASAFNTMLEGIEESFQRLTQFSEDLAHELRTPINNLRGEVETCLAKERTLDEYHQVLASNLEEYHRITRLIEGLLFIAKAENPRATIQRESLGVRAVVEKVSEFYRALAEENAITFSCHGDAKLLADQILLQRAVNNVISNAIKYTPPGGSIHVEIENTATETVQISVRDTGFGIAEKHLSRVFDRFYRTDAARSQDSGGIGLGLAIVKSIMNLHQGIVGIESTPGKGTKVTLVFPVG